MWKWIVVTMVSCTVLVTGAWLESNDTVVRPEWVPIKGSFKYVGPITWIPFSGNKLSTSASSLEELYQKMTRLNYLETINYGGRPLLRHPLINYTESNVVDNQTDGYRLYTTRSLNKITHSAEWVIVNDAFIAIYMFPAMPFGQLYWPMSISQDNMEVFVIHLRDNWLFDPSLSRRPHSITYLATSHRPYPYSIQTYIDDASGFPYDPACADHFLIDKIDGVRNDDSGQQWTYRIDTVNQLVDFSQ